MVDDAEGKFHPGYRQAPGRTPALEGQGILQPDILHVAEPDPRDEISHLETHIDALAQDLERCRKAIQIAKLAIAAGGLWLLVTTFGAVRFNPAATIAAITAVIGGTVIFGSTTTTSKQISSNM